MKPAPWIKCYRPRPAARLRLFCIPYAGGGASTFHSWSDQLPELVEVVAIQLPGREDRFRDKPFQRIEPLLTQLAPVVAECSDVPFAIYGHSMGGLIAFELARYLHQAGGPAPVGLVVSGRRAPGQSDAAPSFSDLPDAEFAQELQRRYGGFPDVIARDPQLLSLFLPMIRADLELVNGHVHRPGPPLPCPIFAYGGLQDSIPVDSLRAWQDQTSGACELQMLPGDHFFINSQRETLLQMVGEQLKQLTPE